MTNDPTKPTIEEQIADFFEPRELNKELAYFQSDEKNVFKIVNMDGLTICDEVYSEEMAKIFTASPALLEHLKFAVKILSGTPVSGSAQVEAMRDAILLAEGQ